MRIQRHLHRLRIGSVNRDKQEPAKMVLSSDKLTFGIVAHAAEIELAAIGWNEVLLQAGQCAFIKLIASDHNYPSR